MATTVLICVDGLDPEYLEACEAPNLRRLRREGVYTVGRSMMPSVTNVNNVSILTAQYPSAHGICSNYRLNRDTGQETYVESDEYILAETMFEVASRQGVSTVMVTSKDKLRTLLSRSVTTSVSSERPPDWVVEAVGPRASRVLAGGERVVDKRRHVHYVPRRRRHRVHLHNRLPNAHIRARRTGVPSEHRHAGRGNRRTAASPPRT